MHAALPNWVTLFLDFDDADHDRGLVFWRDVTGWAVSPARFGDGEFRTLVPPDGDSHLRVQRLGAGPTRAHVDLHVEDVDAAVPAATELGAAVVMRGSDHTVLRSPGGFLFCVVPSAESRRAAPAEWPGGQRSAVDQLCLDVPPRLYDSEAAFWRDLTGWELTAPTDENEFGSLRQAADQPVRFLLQRLDDDQDAVTAHLDLSATDRDAEVARHEQLGARAVQRARQWTVMSGPTGWIYCVTDRDPGTGVSRPQ